MAKALSDSLEDYLEAIHHIVAAKQAARATDISDRMDVTRSSVTGALHALSQRGLVNYAPYDLVTLTPMGQAAADEVVRRHEILRGFFLRVLGVEESDANDAACRIEHQINPNVLRRLRYLAEFLSDRPHPSRGRWLRRFHAFCLERELSPDADGADGAPDGEAP